MIFLKWNLMQFIFGFTVENMLTHLWFRSDHRAYLNLIALIVIFIVIDYVIAACLHWLLIMIGIGSVQYISKATVYRIRNRKTNTYLTAGTEIVTAPLHK